MQINFTGFVKVPPYHGYQRYINANKVESIGFLNCLDDDVVEIQYQSGRKIDLDLREIDIDSFVRNLCKAQEENSVIVQERKQ